MSKNELNREDILKVAALVRPALSNLPYIPALQHVMFDGNSMTTYNDIAAISVRFPTEMKACLPGELFIRALGSFSGDTVVLAHDADKGALTVSSGRSSKIKLPTLPLTAFPLELPATHPDTEIVLTTDLLKGITRCLMATGTDPTHAAQMGCTLDTDDDGYAVVYSTDNHTITRYQTKNKIKLPGGVPILLPTFFCEQLVRLSTAFPKAEAVILLRDGAIVAEFGNDLAVLFTKTINDLQPLNFERVIAQMCALDKLPKVTHDIPPGFDAALDRALLVLAGVNDKATAFDPDEDSFEMLSESPMGTSRDSFKFNTENCHGLFHVDPAHVARAAKICGKMAFLRQALVLTGDDDKLVHLISFVTQQKKD